MAVLETRPEIYSDRRKRLVDSQVYSLSQRGFNIQSSSQDQGRSSQRSGYLPSDLTSSLTNVPVARGRLTGSLTSSFSCGQLIRVHESKQRLRKLRDYLAFYLGASDSLNSTAATAQAILDLLIKEFGCRLAIPTAGIGNGGEIMMLWRVGSKSLEIEILPDQSVELFSIDHSTDAAWEYIISAGQAIPANVLSKIMPLVML
jgi:hypothetical protein